MNPQNGLPNVINNGDNAPIDPHTPHAQNFDPYLQFFGFPLHPAPGAHPPMFPPLLPHYVHPPIPPYHGPGQVVFPPPLPGMYQQPFPAGGFGNLHAPNLPVFPQPGYTPPQTQGPPAGPGLISHPRPNNQVELGVFAFQAQVVVGTPHMTEEFPCRTDMTWVLRLLLILSV
ncbi:hypothetical protein C8Q75DRAFT_809792 [Abortiporus biennis]|nr:hypothetical protein C8Q75DRAFT_809792 [Abortiporus biennis]